MKDFEDLTLFFKNFKLGVVLRQGIKASIITYIGAFLGYLLWLQFFANWLSPDEFGLVKALFDASILLIPFLQGGISSLVIKFSPYLNTNIENEKSLLGFSIMLPFSLSIIGVILFLIFNEQLFNAYIKKSPLFADYMWYVLPMAFFSVYVQLVESLIYVKMRIVVPRIIRELAVRIGNIVAVWFYYLELINLQQLIFSFVFVSVLQLVLLVFYYVHLRGRWIRPNLQIVKSRYFKPLLNYSGFMVLGTGSAGLVSKVDSLMTASLLGLAQTGIYGIAFLIATIIELPRRIFTSLLTPLVANAYKEKRFDLLESYYHKSSINLSVLSVAIFIGIWSNLDLVYEFIPNKEVYQQGRWVVFYIGLTKVFDMSMGINSELLQNSRYYRWNIYLTPILAVLAVGTNLLFIPEMGIVGAALATFITIAMFNIVRYTIVVRKLKISPFKRSNLYVWIFALLSFSLTEVFSLGNLYLNFLFNFIVVMLVFIFPIWKLKLSEEINGFIYQILKKAGIIKK